MPTTLPPPPFSRAFLDPDGRVSNPWQVFIWALYDRLGGSTDKLDAAYVAALAAAPASTQVVGAGGLKGGGSLGANVGVTLYLASAVVASLPTAGVAEGDWAYALNGRKAGEAAGAGTGVPVWFSAGAWFAVDSGLGVTS